MTVLSVSLLDVKLIRLIQTHFVQKILVTFNKKHLSENPRTGKFAECIRTLLLFIFAILPVRVYHFRVKIQIRPSYFQKETNTAINVNATLCPKQRAIFLFCLFDLALNRREQLLLPQPRHASKPHKLTNYFTQSCKFLRWKLLAIFKCYMIHYPLAFPARTLLKI